jgi:hypothetical protein
MPFPMPRSVIRSPIHDEDSAGRHRETASAEPAAAADDQPRLSLEPVRNAEALDEAEKDRQVPAY